MNGVGGTAGGVGRQGDGQGADDHAVAQTGNCRIEPCRREIGEILGRGYVGCAEGGRRCKGNLLGEVRRAVQRMDRDVQTQDAERITAEDIGRDWYLDGVSSGNHRISRRESDGRVQIVRRRAGNFW